MYTGTIVPLVTPLTDDDTVDERSVARLINTVRDDVTALMPALSSGEGWALSADQWEQMITASCAVSDGLPVLAGVQLPTTPSVTERARRAAVLGADAVVVTTPFGAHITQDEIYQHVAQLCATVPVPLFLYNEAAVSDNQIEAATLQRIVELPGITGIKESSGDPELTRQIIAAAPGLPVFQGWENLLLQVPDVAGFIGPLANVEPALCNRMLTEPTEHHQGEVDAACLRYGLLGEEWYRTVKTELVRRGVLTSDRVVTRSEVSN